MLGLQPSVQSQRDSFNSSFLEPAVSASTFLEYAYPNYFAKLYQNEDRWHPGERVVQSDVPQMNPPEGTFPASSFLNDENTPKEPPQSPLTSTAQTNDVKQDAPHESGDAAKHSSEDDPVEASVDNNSSSNLVCAMELREGTISELFEQRTRLLLSTLENLRNKCQTLGEELSEAQYERSHANERSKAAETSCQNYQAELDNTRDRERRLRQDVSRLEALLDSQRLQSSFTEHKLQASLTEERLRGERLRSLHDSAVLQRDDALSELATAYADLDAMQATLADSAVYVRYLRKRVLELELQTARNGAGGGGNGAGGGGGGNAAEAETGVFSATSVRNAVKAAVADAMAAPTEEERRKKLRQLQLRWHPDKNPVLTEFASEVTKIINEAVAKAD